MNKEKILIVEDEINIVDLIKINLENSGYEVLSSYTGMEAISKIHSDKPDLVLLDLALPDIDGLQICQMIRRNDETKDIPIIMVTARSEEDDKVEGLTMGADDYITKPFGIRELEARIETVLRRYNRKTSNIEGIDSKSSIIQLRDIKMNLNKHEVTKKDEKIDLTLTEFKILKIIMENRDNVTSRNNLLDEIGIDKSNLESRTLDVHIRNIRKKLEEDLEHEYIETVRGIGYKFKVGE